MNHSGQQCNACFQGRFQTRGVRNSKSGHIRFLKCDRCGRCSKEVVDPSKIVRRLKSAAYSISGITEDTSGHNLTDRKS